LKSKWAIGLLCLLLFVAAVDTIPDPPAINPPANHGSVSGLHLRGTFNLLEKQWYGNSGATRSSQSDRFSIQLRLDEPPVRISPLPRVHHAADTSPPQFSLSDPQFA
jgi:hypothetical protein